MLADIPHWKSQSMKNVYWAIFLLPLVLFPCKVTTSPAVKRSEAATTERCNQMTITGIAEHAKMGAIIVADDGNVYYIEGKQNWDQEGYYKKKVRVSGTH